jgi:tight adherence protein B
MRNLLPVLLGLAVVGVLEAAYYLLRYFQDRRVHELQRRLQSLGVRQDTPSLLRAGKLSTNPTLDEILRAVPILRRLEHLLEQADVDTTVARLLLYAAVLGGAGLFGGILAHAGPAAPVLLAMIGMLSPVVVIFILRSRRSDRVSEQLPDALDMMARSLRAGHALQNAFQLVAIEAPSPINIEFGRAYEEQRLGRTLEQAVVAITERVPQNADLRILAVSIAIQKQTGGNLAEILEKIAETIRSRYRFFGKLKSLTAEGRMSGVILGALPLCMGMFMAVANPTYMRPLFDDQIGNYFLYYAVGSWTFGLVWMFRMTKVDL